MSAWVAIRIQSIDLTRSLTPYNTTDDKTNLTIIANNFIRQLPPRWNDGTKILGLARQILQDVITEEPDEGVKELTEKYEMSDADKDALEAYIARKLSTAVKQSLDAVGSLAARAQSDSGSDDDDDDEEEDWYDKKSFI